MKNLLFIKSPDSSWFELSRYFENSYNWKCIGWISHDRYKKNFYKYRTNSYEKFFNQDKFFLNNIDFYLESSSKINYDEELKDIYSKSKFYYPIIYELIDRWFDFSYTNTKDLKKKYINKIIKDMNIFINQNKIDIIISPTIPHRVFDYILYILCKIKKKAFLMIEVTTGIIHDRGKLKCLYFGMFSIENRTKHMFNTKIDNLSINNKTKEYLEFVDQEKNNLKYDYVQKKEKISRSLVYKLKKNTPKNIRLTFSIFKNLIKFNYSSGYRLDTKSKNFSKKNNYINNFKYKLHIHKKNIKALDFYTQNSIKELPKKKFLYFAASKTPERSSCPDAGLFFDSMRVLKKLSSNIDRETIIIYKEHPSNFYDPYEDHRRDYLFYEKLTKLGNIIFIDHNYPSISLIDNSYLVSSITGTPCYEASLRGKQSLIFGSTWYECLNSVTVVKNSKDLIKFFKSFKYKSDESIKKNNLYFHSKIINNSYDLNFRRKKNFGEIEINNKSFKEKIELYAKAYFTAYEFYQKFEINS